jgi:hypothetical protein
MQTFRTPALLLGAMACFAAGAVACYLVLKPVVRFAEEAPLHIISEQTNVLKHLRAGKEEEITKLLEQVVWLQISAHADRMDQGNPPPVALSRDIAYHCQQLRGASDTISPEARQARERWCSTLKV